MVEIIHIIKTYLLNSQGHVHESWYVDTHSKCILFADDTTIYASSNNLNDLRTQIESSLSDWFYANKLSLNVSKTNLQNSHCTRPQYQGSILYVVTWHNSKLRYTTSQESGLEGIIFEWYMIMWLDYTFWVIICSCYLGKYYSCGAMPWYQQYQLRYL